MSTENENQKSLQLLSKMTMFFSDVQNLADVEEQDQDLDTLFRAFLVGDYANEETLRNSILVMYDQYKALYQLLFECTTDDVKEALLLISKYRAHGTV